jgi:CRP-like cAMP-binding protein
VNRLLARLDGFARLSEAERVTLRGAVSTHRRHATSQISVTGASPPDGILIVLNGFACRYRVVGAGRRQILGYLVAGDLCGLRLATLKRTGYYIGAFGPTETAILAPERILSCPDRCPNLIQALRWALLTEESIAREWITNVGQRTAYERVAHLICEMFVRLQRVGLTEEDRCALPLTQRDLGDALSLSSVHVNRVLRQMRLDGLAIFRHGQLVLTDRSALHRVAGFDSTYLHLQTRS